MTVTPTSTGRWVALFLSAGAIIAGFSTVNVGWDQHTLSGMDFAKGDFFATSAKEYALSNPFPATNKFLIGALAIPAFAIITQLLLVLRKNTTITGIIAAIGALCLSTFFYLFNGILTDLGVVTTTKYGLWMSVLGAVSLILLTRIHIAARLVLIILFPLLTWAGFKFASGQVESQQFDNTDVVQSDFTVDALSLIREFAANDSAANAKYREKILTVNGSISSVEQPNDSTATIRFTDTTGSYAIFPFEGEAAKPVKDLKAGDAVSIKASCSGGVYSEIMETETISFKRCIINKK